jgi:dihydroorotate dehydrogenase (NAD+) catalytic subunit
MKPEIAVVLSGMRLRSPTILSAGVLGISAETMKRVADSGAGAVVTKSTGIEARTGHPAPNIVEVQSGLLNAMGLPNPGIKQMSVEIQKLARSKVPVIASVYGFNVRDYALVADQACSAGVSAVELNVSCPNVGKVGCEFGQDADMVGRITRTVKAKVNRPVFVKLSPNVTDIVEIGRAAEKSGADGVTAINTLSGMAIDINTKMPILGAKKGGLSGPVIKPIALRCVYDLYESLRIPIIGCGGISSWKDAVEFLLAGAASVQIGTGIMYRDLAIFREVNEGIVAYMMDNKFQKTREIMGLAHRR